MNTFAHAVKTQETRTTNGMKALKGSGNSCVNMFYNIAAMRGQDPTVIFSQALAENEDLALRIMQWSRDVRGGAGERVLFRKMLKHLEAFHPDTLTKLMPKVPEVGRWDDMLIFTEASAKKQSFELIGDALRAENALAAKWLPRENNKTRKWVLEFCGFFGVTPKFYRKMVSRLTKVVEQQMCAKDWDGINFSHVPSVAASRYKKAFLRNAPESYKSYIEKLVKGDDPEVKINASAIFPHDVIKDIIHYGSVKNTNSDELKVITAQWDSLPNYVGDSAVLAMVDTSGSMFSAAVPGSTNLFAGQIALSLGLYTADKNTGPFKDTFLTFNAQPTLFHLQGTIVDKCRAMVNAPWDVNTDVIAGFELILSTALKGGVKNEDMPKTLLILSDMQFDRCASYDDSAMQSIERRFTNAGYDVPNVVFWNLKASNNTPVKSDKSGAALVSGFSPAILKSILDGSGEFTPEGIMLKTVMQDKYSLE